MAFDVKRDTTTFTTRLRASEGGRHVKRLKLRRSLGGTGSPMRSLPPRKLELRRLSPKQASLNGQVLRRGDHVQRRVAEGWRVAERGPKRIFEGPDGRDSTESDLTKTGLDYASIPHFFEWP